VSYVYSQYWKYRYEVWFEVQSNEDAGYLRASLLNKYAEDCEFDGFNRTNDYLNVKLELYERLAKSIPDIAFTDGRVFRDGHLKSIVKIRSNQREAQDLLSLCKST
jgi:hypothetical protein